MIMLHLIPCLNNRAMRNSHSLLCRSMKKVVLDYSVGVTRGVVCLSQNCRL